MEYARVDRDDVVSNLCQAYLTLSSEPAAQISLSVLSEAISWYKFRNGRGIGLREAELVFDVLVKFTEQKSAKPKEPASELDFLDAIVVIHLVQSKLHLVTQMKDASNLVMPIVRYLLTRDHFNTLISENRDFFSQIRKASAQFEAELLGMLTMHVSSLCCQTLLFELKFLKYIFRAHPK